MRQKAGGLSRVAHPRQVVVNRPQRITLNRHWHDTWSEAVHHWRRRRPERSPSNRRRGAGIVSNRSFVLAGAALRS